VSRKEWPREVQIAVLLDSKHRCALCFGLHYDFDVKKGQIAHIDRDSSNSTLENAAWLCLEHHDEYDTKPSQTKGFMPEELQAHKHALLEVMTDPSAFAYGSAHLRTRKGKGVSLEVHDRRVPTYRKATEFIRLVLKGGRLEIVPILQFAADTDEALFLFDDKIAEYLRLLFKQALKLQVTSLSTHSPEQRTRELVDQEVGLLAWFVDQLDETRNRFAPYLRLK
jgi:hypothetical protein